MDKEEALEGEIISTKYPMAIGRPSKYTDEMPYKALALRMQGKSQNQVMAYLGITQHTYESYVREHQAFREAHDLGYIYALASWEEILEAVATGKLKGSAAMIEFQMKTRFPKEYSVRNESLHINVNATTSLSQEQLDEEIKRLRHLDKPEAINAIEERKE